jgi:acyl carrier protein phosphodiesterase
LQAKPLLPETALETITWMQSAVAFVRYADETFIDRALKSISRRLRRDNPLATGIESFQQNRPGLEEDFTLFMPQVTQFAEQWISDNL